MKLSFAQYLLEKTKNDYSQIARDFSYTRVFPWDEFKYFKEYIKKGNKVLDVGCGNGRLYEFLKGKNIDYTGIDISPELIKIAKEKYSDANFEVGDILNLKFQKEQFDIVFCIAVLHHIPSKDFRLKALKEINRVLKKDGILILTVWNLWQLKYIKYILKYTFLKLIGQSKLDFKDIFFPWKSQKPKIIQRYYHVFTPRELKKLLQKAGFKVEEAFYTKKDKKTRFFNSFNICVVARKH